VKCLLKLDMEAEITAGTAELARRVMGAVREVWDLWNMEGGLQMMSQRRFGLRERMGKDPSREERSGSEED
jgi:hypothetical protein